MTYTYVSRQHSVLTSVVHQDIANPYSSIVASSFQDDPDLFIINVPLITLSEACDQNSPDQPPPNPQTSPADQLSHTPINPQHVGQPPDAVMTPTMSSPQGTHETTPSSGDEARSGTGKARLTEDQKKANHITSEKKRRKTIRGESIRITKIIPGAAADFRSEQKVIAHVADYTAQLLQERAELIRELEVRGLAVEERLKNPRVNS